MRAGLGVEAWWSLCDHDPKLIGDRRRSLSQRGHCSELSPLVTALGAVQRSRSPSQPPSGILVFYSPTQRKMIFWFGVGQSEYPR